MTVPFDTSWPFFTAIEVTVPAAVDGTSMDALSLSSVMSGSSTRTALPTFTRTSTTVTP